MSVLAAMSGGMIVLVVSMVVIGLACLVMLIQS